jgi:hypothetical protein
MQWRHVWWMYAYYTAVALVSGYWVHVRVFLGQWGSKRLSELMLFYMFDVIRICGYRLRHLPRATTHVSATLTSTSTQTEIAGVEGRLAARKRVDCAGS